MKKLIYIFVSLILLSSLFPTANYSTPASELEIILESPEASEFDLVQSRAVLLNRLEAYGIIGAEIALRKDQHQLLVTLPDAAAQEPILPLLIAKGELVFSKTFTREEMVKMLENSPYRQQWRQWITVDASSLGKQGNNADLADLDRREISAFMKFIEGPDNLQELPPYLRFTFSRFANQDDQLGLYALKFGKEDRILLSSRAVKEASTQTNEATGSVSIFLSFHKEAADQWAQVTRENLNRSIAMVIDDLVYFAPTVRSEITGGKAQITGQFTVQEAKTLAAIIQGGELPVELQLISN